MSKTRILRALTALLMVAGVLTVVAVTEAGPASAAPYYPYNQGWPGPVQQGYDRPEAADYNGDGNADIAVVRNTGSGYSWYINGVGIFPFGIPGDIPAPGKYFDAVFLDKGVYDASLLNRAEMAVYRPSNGTWYIASWTTGVTYTVQWGLSGDLPVPGSYSTSDGYDDIAVFRHSDSTVYDLQTSATWQPLNWYDGTPGGIHTVCTTQPSCQFSPFQIFPTRTLNDANSCPLSSACYSADRPDYFDRYAGYSHYECHPAELGSVQICDQSWQQGVTGDTAFNYDWGRVYLGTIAGTALYSSDVESVSMWSLSNQTYYVRSQNIEYGNTTVFSQQWGLPGDYDVSNNFYPETNSVWIGLNGHVKTNLAVYRPCNGTWYILAVDRTSYTTVQFGQPLGGC